MHLPIHRIYRLFFGFLALSALLIQMYASREFLADFFSYFTMLSNIAAIGLFLYLGFKNPQKNSRRFDWFRGAVTLYMTITGVIYWSVLRNQPDLAVYPWINLVAHGLMPIAVLLDWIDRPPKTKFTWKISFQWLVFPVLYLFYSLIRGSIVHWYPYFFINPTKTSPEDMIKYILMILAVGFGLALLLVKLSRRK